MENNTPIAFKVTLTNYNTDGFYSEYLTGRDSTYFDNPLDADIVPWAEDGLRISRFVDKSLIDKPLHGINYLKDSSNIESFVRNEKVIGTWIEGVFRTGISSATLEDIEYRVEVVARPNIDIKKTVEEALKESDISEYDLTEIYFNGEAYIKGGDTIRMNGRTIVHTYSPLSPMVNFVVEHLKSTYKEDFLFIGYEAMLVEDSSEDRFTIFLETKTPECAKAILKEVFNVNPDLVVPEFTRGKGDEVTSCKTVVHCGDFRFI